MAELEKLDAEEKFARSASLPIDAKWPSGALLLVYRIAAFLARVMVRYLPFPGALHLGQVWPGRHLLNWKKSERIEAEKEAVA